MSLASTLSSSSPSAEAVAKPRNGSATNAAAGASNRRGPGSGASGDFASLLRGQSAPDDEAAVASKSGTRPADETSASAEEEGGETASAAAANASKQPSKQQPGAEDLPPTLQAWGRPQPADAAAGAARETGSRLGALARGAHRSTELPGADRAELPAAMAAGKLGAAPGAEVAQSSAEALAASAVVPLEAASAASDGSLPSLLAAGEANAATPAAPLLQALAEAPAPVPEARATLEPTPGTPAFTEALGVQLSTWLEAGVQHAVLELHPEDLGPIDVRISMRDGDTRVELGALVDSTRAALTDAMPQLAEALGDVGLSLSGGSVSDQTAGGFAQPGNSGDERRALTSAASLARAFGRTELGAADAADAAVVRQHVAARGLLDLYA
jgi:flagellar hook-length control protein FliK